MNGVEIPTFSRSVSLSPQQQTLYDQQTAMGSQLNALGASQLSRLSDTLSQPLNLDGLPNAVTSVGADVGTDASRQRIEDALMQRLNPSIQQQGDSLETKLVNQGLVRGSTAFNQAMDEQNRSSNDARLAVVGQAGQEQSRELSDAISSANFQNTARQNALQERLTTRETPINEVAALMNGGQVTAPQFSAFNPGNVAGTPVGQYVYQSAAQNMDAWKTQTQQDAAARSSLYQLGGAALGGLASFGVSRSDRRLKRAIRDLGVRLANGLRLYAYRYLWSDEPQVGVMADEVEGVFPSAVITDALGLKWVDYGQVA